MSKKLVNQDLAEHRKKKATSRKRATEQHLLEQIEFLKSQLDANEALVKSVTTDVIRPSTTKGQSEATAVVLASDWHAEEEIRASEVNGLNSMNLDIAKKRSVAFFERIVKLTTKERQDVTIKNLVLWLGGDFISGSLHDDNLQNALLPPTLAIAFVQGLLDTGMTYLKEHGGFDKVVIVCSSGNHSRISRKVAWAAHEGNSLEWLMYNNLASRHPEFKWVIDKSLLTYLKVYDQTLRFSHGHWCSHAGGVGSFFPVLLRKMYQFNQTKYADVTLLGHLHTYTPNRRFTVNGSFAGPNPFAFSFAAPDIQPPTQSFFLLDKKRGVTVQIPILL